MIEDSRRKDMWAADDLPCWIPCCFVASLLWRRCQSIKSLSRHVHRNGPLETVLAISCLLYLLIFEAHLYRRRIKWLDLYRGSAELEVVFTLSQTNIYRLFILLRISHLHTTDVQLRTWDFEHLKHLPVCQTSLLSSEMCQVQEVITRITHEKVVEARHPMLH